MLGAARPMPKVVDAVLDGTLPSGGDRREFLRGAWDGARVVPQMMRDSSALAAMAASNCLIERPAGASASQAGDHVRIYLLENGGGWLSNA